MQEVDISMRVVRKTIAWQHGLVELSWEACAYGINNMPGVSTDVTIAPELIRGYNEAREWLNDRTQSMHGVQVSAFCGL